MDFIITSLAEDAEADTPIAAAAEAVGVDDEVFDVALFDVEAVVVEHDVLEVPLGEGAVDELHESMSICSSFWWMKYPITHPCTLRPKYIKNNRILRGLGNSDVYLSPAGQTLNAVSTSKCNKARFSQTRKIFFILLRFFLSLCSSII